MKTLYLIGGTMGVGKTAVSRELEKLLDNAVFLDGDWCWDSDPFRVTEETKSMVLQNITFLLNQFLRCSAYENIIFCWVMHEQAIIDRILNGLDRDNCRTVNVSLVCSEKELRRRLEKDIRSGIRTEDIVERSTARLTLYEALDTVNVNTDGKSAAGTAAELALM